MWNPDIAPRMGFEQLARRFGLAKARRMWEAHGERIKAAAAQAAKQEEAWAAERHRKGPIVLKDDWIRPQFHIAPYTFKAMHASTKPQRGCVGGEALEDDETIRDFLKRNPHCAPQKVITGDIRSGWTARLERAAVFGRCERALTQMQANHRLQAAAAEGRQQQPLIAA
jgi:hypothetical protein